MSAEEFYIKHKEYTVCVHSIATTTIVKKYCIQVNKEISLQLISHFDSKILVTGDVNMPLLSIQRSPRKK